MILRVIKDFFYLSNLWTRFEGVDNLTAFDSVMLKCSFSQAGAYLSLNCCKKTNVWYSKDFYLCFLFLIETFPVVLCHHISIHDNTVSLGALTFVLFDLKLFFKETRISSQFIDAAL